MGMAPTDERRLDAAIRKVKAYQARKRESAEVARITREAEEIRRLEQDRAQLEADLKRGTKLKKLKEDVHSLEAKEQQLKEKKKSLFRQIQSSPATKKLIRKFT